MVSLASALVLIPSVQIDAATTNTAPAAVWDTSVRATAGVGYRDNVLRSRVASESSGFFVSAADATFIRLTESGSHLTLFLLGEDTRYFDAPAVRYEQLFSSTAQGATPVGVNDEVGGQFNHLYQRQVLDVSETEADLRRVLVDGHSFTLRPHWKHALGRGWAVQLEGAALRQLYGGDLDDYWEAGGGLSVIRGYGHRSEFSLTYSSRHLLFDTREQFDRAGLMVPDTSLVYWQHELLGQWRHHWDRARRWRTTSKLSGLFNRDNGSGYFDYDRLRFTQQVRWAAGGWDIKANGRFGWYWYPVQRTGREHRERAYATLDLRVERRLGQHWLLYATAEREWNWSNDPLDEYNDWTGGAGLGVEF